MGYWSDIATSLATGFKKGIGKSSAWVIFNGLIGTLPLLVIMLLMSISSDTHSKSYFSEKLYRTFQDCALMFVCCGLTAAVMLDFALSKIKPGNNLISFGLFGSGFLAIILVIILFVNTMNNQGNEAKVDFGFYYTIQTIVIVYTFIYTLTIKTYLYAKEDAA